MVEKRCSGNSTGECHLSKPRHKKSPEVRACHRSTRDSADQAIAHVATQARRYDIDQGLTVDQADKDQNNPTGRTFVTYGSETMIPSGGGKPCGQTLDTPVLSFDFLCGLQGRLYSKSQTARNFPVSTLYWFISWQLIGCICLSGLRQLGLDQRAFTNPPFVDERTIEECGPDPARVLNIRDFPIAPASMSANSTSPNVAAVFHFLEKNDYGPLLASAFISFALWGMLYMQVYTYYSSGMSTQDHLYVRVMVGVAAMLESFLTFLYAHITYFYMVYNFGNPSALPDHPWSLNIVWLSREVQMLAIRCLFLRRLFVLSRSKIVTAWVLLWSLLELGTGIALTVEFVGFGPIFTYPESFYHTVYVSSAGILVADTSLAAALCYYLHKSRTGYKRTDSMIQLFILYCISTTAIVFVVAIIATALFMVFGRTYLEFPFLEPQTKFYLMAYMITLNGRENLRNQREEPQSINLPVFSHMSAQTRSGGGGFEKPAFGDISVETAGATYKV